MRGFRILRRPVLAGLSRCIAAVLLMTALAGCTAVRMGIGSDGVDVEKIRTGMKRAEIDAVLGPPLYAKGAREVRWYATYAVDQGRPASGKRAMVGVMLDITTLGVLSPFVDSSQPVNERPLLVVVYDADETAIGLFDDSFPIPADGRSTERPQALIRENRDQTEGEEK